MKHRQLSFLTTVGLAALLCGPVPAGAVAVAPNLGTAAAYGVVSSTFTGNGAATNVDNGNLCYTSGPGSFAPTFTGGGVLVGPPCPPQTGVDIGTALTTMNTQPCLSLGSAVNLSLINVGSGSGTLPPGCYSSTGAMSVGSTLTLSGTGIYVFRSGGALNTAANSVVSVTGGACEGDVYWAPIATTLGANSTFVGTILDNNAITIGSTAILNGRALNYATTVTADADTINVPAVCAPPPNPIAPTISKSFAAAAIGVDGVSRLTITLSNADTSIATLTSAFVDTLPAGVVIAASPNATTTCAGTGAVVAVAGGSTVTLPAPRSIPAGGSCTVAVNVTASAVGSYLNVIPASALDTTNGSNAAPAEATLVVDESVPTLPGWAMIMLAALLALAGFTAMRRREA